MAKRDILTIRIYEKDRENVRKLQKYRMNISAICRIVLKTIADDLDHVTNEDELIELKRLYSDAKLVNKFDYKKIFQKTKKPELQ